jgi:hypothetical protein
VSAAGGTIATYGARRLDSFDAALTVLGLGMAVRAATNVTATSNALDLERGVFTLRSARAIAQSLKRSAERSRRKRGTSYQSAMSMLNFYINRGGRQAPDGAFCERVASLRKS